MSPIPVLILSLLIIYLMVTGRMISIINIFTNKDNKPKEGVHDIPKSYTPYDPYNPDRDPYKR